MGIAKTRCMRGAILGAALLGIRALIFQSAAFRLDAAEPRLTAIERARLCVTEGAIEELPGRRLLVSASKMRAIVTGATAQVVEARVTYQGPTEQEARLASGAMRRQFGLKLRAQDGCNLVYAMWRIEPESKLVVSVKRNPGMSKSSECGNHGYTNIKARRSSPVPRMNAGESHTLRAEMNGSELRVSVDGRVAWEGDVGPEALSLNGPVGVRTDSGRFQFELFAEELPRNAPTTASPCREDSGGSE